MARILVVDDHEEERVKLWEFLRTHGHVLSFAGDGETGFKLWAKKDPDVVVTELYIPEMNGLRLISKIMEADPGARIIAYSEISADQLLTAEDLGACCSLRKPVDHDDFLKAVAIALEGVKKSTRGDW
jgi:DNA-binding NtrC family response regulator